MQINRNVIFCVLLFSIGCRQGNTKIENVKIKDSTKVEKKTISSTHPSLVDGFIKESFVISCGSGCAISYSPEIITQINEDISVKFNVKMYEDELLTDTYEDIYIFSYKLNKLDKIRLDGKSENYLETLMPDAQQSFKDFGNNLITKKKIDFKKQSNLTGTEKYNINVLPFDFETYYTVCDKNIKECEVRYPFYTYPENKNILEYYGIKKNPSKFFLLPKINNLQPIILAYLDSDIEGYDLIISEKGNIISFLEIAKFDGEKIEDFIIKENFEVELYLRKDASQQRLIQKRYKMQDNGSIIQISL